MPSEIHTHIQPWSLALPVALALAAVGLVYMRGWFGLRTAYPNMIPAWRVAAFIGGLFSVWIAVGSPLVTLDHYLLTIHMAKHLLLMAVGPPLILWGTPTLPLLCGLPKFLQLDLPLRNRRAQWIG